MGYVTGEGAVNGNVRVPERATPGHDDVSGNESVGRAPPHSFLASGVPRIVILDENAVYDHYMRRLSKVWMRRIKASRKQASAQSNLHPGDPSLRRVVRAPPFMEDTNDRDVNHRRHRRRPSSGTELRLRQSRGTEKARAAGLRPKSAPVSMKAPTKAWADQRDRAHAARGPGPTSSRHRCHHGDCRDDRSPVSAARPDSAPTLHGRHELDAVLPSRERSLPKQRHASAWLPPRVTRLERETHDLLTACRKASRDMRCPARWNDEERRHERMPEGQMPCGGGKRRRRSEQSNSYGGSFWSDEKIEDMGRGAVIRLIGNLGMGRYAHRFRAFAVTGSDLASCTEEDLLQIGVTFRPHRMRLLKEIAFRKGKRHGGDTRKRDKSSYTATNTRATNNMTTTSTAHGGHHSPGMLAIPGNSVPSGPEQTLPPGTFPTVFTRDGTSASKEPMVTGRTNEVTESTSTSTACTFYERAVAPAVEPASLAEDCASTARVEDDSSDGLSRRREDGKGQRALPVSELVAGSQRIQQGESYLQADGAENPLEGVESTRGRSENTKRQFQARASSEFHRKGLMIPSAQTNGESAEQGLTTPGLKGTLQMCGVRTADMKLALVGRDPFLRVKACDQLRRINVTAGAGAEASWDDAAVSFSVTDKALTSDGVQIELCCGNIGGQDLFASGSIPGDATMQLLCRLRSGGLETGRTSADESLAGDSDVVTASRSLAVVVRLFAKAGGEEAGVCTLTLKFRPEYGVVVANDAADNRSKEQSDMIREPKTAAMEEIEAEARKARRIEGAEHHESSLTLLEETAKHIEASSQVCQHACRQKDNDDRNHGIEVNIGCDKIQSPAASVSDRREAQAAEEIPLLPGKIEGILVPHDAAVILQSHTRRRAADRIAKRRVKERTATNRVQAFARQRMEVSKVRRARECELATMHQERSHAVVRLQSTARRRIAAKVVQRRRGEKKELSKRNTEAAQTLQGFARQRLRERAQRKQIAARKVQGISSIRAAKAEARRRRVEKQLEAKRRSAEEAAALQIQTTVRRQRATHESHLVKSREQNRAAVKLQTMVRSRSAQTKVCRQRGRQALLKTAARITVQDALKRGLDNCVALIMEKWRRAESDCLRHTLARKSEAATGATSQVALAESNAEATVTSARILHAFDQKQQQANANDEPYPSLSESELVPKESGGTKSNSCAAVPLATANDTPTEQDDVEPPHVRDNVESLRQVEVAAAAEEQRAAARRIQGLCRKRRARRQNESGDPLPHSPPAASASCTTRFTQELMASRKSEQAATHIQRAFRDWCLARQARGLRARKTTAAICIQQATRSRTACNRVANLRAKQNDLVQNELRAEAERESARCKAAECIQRGVRARLALETVNHFKRQKLAEAQQSTAAECIQRLVRRKQADDLVAYLRKQRQNENRRAQELEELTRQQTAEREAATSIQRSVRSKQASDRVSNLRHEREADIQRNHERSTAKQEEIRQDAAMCIQRAARCRQASLKGAGARQRRDAELQRELQEAGQRRAAECIQRSVRSKQASDRVDALRQEREVEVRRAQARAMAEEEEMRRDAAACIQRAARCRQARLRVNAARKRRDAELQHELQEAKQTTAAECIQRSVRSKQASDRVDALRQEREVEVRRAQAQAMAEEEEMRRDAAACIQRAARCRQARLRVNAARKRRDAELQRELQEAKQTTAAECIQRSVRSKQASDRVDALRQEREVEVRRAQARAMAEEEEMRRDAAACIQRAARCRQARLRVNAARKRRDAELQRELQEAKQTTAAECIQRSVRSKQASDRVDALRQEREVEVRRAQARAMAEEEEMRRDAAACIQRAARCRQARLRVNAARKRRDAELQRELQEAKQTTAAECIQRSVRSKQASDRVDALRQEREVEVRRAQARAMAEEEEMRRDAAACIQRAARCRQARLRVNAARKRRDAELQRELQEAKQTTAAECIQRSVRSKQASDRVDALRQEREVEVRRAQAQAMAEEEEMRRDAAACIQRAARCRQARLRVNAARKRRDAELQRELQEAKQTTAAECIQRSVRSKQASDRVDALRQEREVEVRRAQARAMAEEEEMRRDAAACIQRAARCRQARLRVNAARKRRDAELQHELQEAKQTTAAECIQRSVRSKQASDRVDALRQEREVEVRRAQARAMAEEEEMRRDAAACIQRAVRCRQAFFRAAAARQKRGIGVERMLYEVEMEQESKIRREAAERIQCAIRLCLARRRTFSLKRQRDVKISRKQELERKHQTAEQDSEPLSLKFAKMMEAARQGSAPAMNDEIGTTPALLPPQEQATTTRFSTASELMEDVTQPHGSDLSDFDRTSKDTNKDGRDGGKDQDSSGKEIWEVAGAPAPANDLLNAGNQPTVVSGTGRDSTKGGSGHEISRWSDSSNGTESSTASGSDLGESRSSDELSRDEEQLVKTSAEYAKEVAFGRSKEPHDEQEKEIDTSEELLQPDPEVGTPSSPRDAAEVRSEESSRLQMQLVEIPAAVNNADPPQGKIEMGPGTSPQHPKRAERPEERPEEPRSDSLTNQEGNGHLVAEHPSTGGEIAGGWEPHVDKESGATYYFHPETRACLWELPSDAQEARVDEAMPHEEAETSVLQASKADSPPSLIRSRAADTTETMVEIGGDGHLLEEGVDDLRQNVEGSPDGFETGRADALGRVVVDGEVVSPQEDGYAADGHHLGERDGWQEIVDPETGSSYFYNPMTRQSTWDMPEGAIQAAIHAAGVAAGKQTT